MKEKLHDKFAWLWKASPFILALLFSLNVVAQAQTVSGKLTRADDNTGLPGVNVVVEGITVGTVTDLYGEYSLET